MNAIMWHVTAVPLHKCTRAGLNNVVTFIVAAVAGAALHRGAADNVQRGEQDTTGNPVM
jgi:hypothetical protein